MKWRIGRRSQNIEDRRGWSNAGMRRGPMRFPFPMGRGGGGFPGGRTMGGGLGIGGLIIFAVLALVFGVDPGVLFQDTTQVSPAPRSGPPAVTSPQEQELTEFVSVVLADTEDTWHELFAQIDGQYQEPTLVLFSGAVESACGFAQSAVGPFYCPGDYKVYLDFSFFDDLHRRHGAPGDFAQAYVIAHEVGHHVQNLLGISGEVQAARAGLDQASANALLVRLELQADCFAGLWAHHAERTRDLLDEGDIDEGLRAASAIGDDRLQRQTRGYVVPESFTHGTSAQRVEWFRNGFEGGTLQACDTFGAAEF